MATENISPNMNMPVPVAGETPGPNYADDEIACYNIIDAHDHTSGSGVLITPSALNINSDLPFGGNNQTNVKSTRYSAQSVALVGASDLDCVYVVGVDLYYNDGNGNNVRITQGGNVAGSTGSISGLSAPASASFNSGTATFIWQSAANIAANMDFRSAIFRNSGVSSFGLTLSAPTLSANYGIVLPSLPVAARFLSIDAAGNIGSTWNVDNSTIENSSGTIQVKDNGITNAKMADNSVNTAELVALSVTTAKIADSAVTTAKIADANVTAIKLAAQNFATSNSSASYTTNSTSYTDVTNLEVNLTITGTRPVFIGMMSDGSTAAGVQMSASAGVIGLFVDAGARGQLNISAPSGSGVEIPPTSFWTIVPISALSASTINIKAKAKVASGANTMSVTNCFLTAYEM